MLRGECNNLPLYHYNNTSCTLLYDIYTNLYQTYKYKLGNPLKKDTTLGPVVKLSAAKFIEDQMNLAVKQGAKKIIDDSKFDYPKEHKNYMVPQVLINVNHEMKFMVEETFGPCVGIMPVDNEKMQLN